MVTMVTSVVPQIIQTWFCSQFPIIWMFQLKEDMVWPKEEFLADQKQWKFQAKKNVLTQVIVPQLGEPLDIFPPKFVPH